MFKFRSGTNALNKELGRHRGKNDDGHDKLTWLEASSVCTCYNRYQTCSSLQLTYTSLQQACFQSATKYEHLLSKHASRLNQTC